MNNPNEPVYSAKLKAAMEEIKAVIRKYDIGAIVALHTPEIIDGAEGADGAGEFLLELTPSYSAIKWNATRDGVVIQGHRKHYGGDTDVRNKKLRDTINMLKVLTDSAGPMVLHVLELLKQAEETWDTEHTDGTFTPNQAPLN